MAERDSRGRFIRSPASTSPEEDDETSATPPVTEENRNWRANPQGGVVSVETGRGNAVSVPVGAPFQSTIESIAEQANYGGYFRVFLNGSEILEPSEAPQSIEEGMRIAIVAYDKVG